MAALSRIAIDKIEVSTHAVPTYLPESGGILEWNSTTLVLVRSHGGNEHGLGYTYADTDIGGVDPVATPRPSERLPAHPMIQQ